MDASDPPAFGGATGVGGTATDDDDRVLLIRTRAHELWEQAGRRGGVDIGFWLAAEREIDAAEADEGLGR
jgi:hypothetical protein